MPSKKISVSSEVSNLEKVTVTVDGMTCITCAEKLQFAFEKIKASSKVIVDLEAETAVIFVKSDEKLSDKIIMKIVNEEQLKLVSVKRSRAQI